MEAFMKKEEKEIINAKFKVKNQTMLETGISGDFNSCRITIEAKSIMIVHKNQTEKLVLVDVKDNAKKQQYVKQCTCSIYIASICSLKTTCDYSITAQSKESSNDNIALLNKWIQWQLDNKMRGLCFKVIDLLNAKLFVFVDESFAKNKNQSTQISYIIILTNKYLHINTNKFTIEGNIIYWSLIKYQRIIPSVLANEIYSMVNRFDLRFVIK